jgi:hypothetical protein
VNEKALSRSRQPRKDNDPAVEQAEQAFMKSRRGAVEKVAG